MKKENRGLYAKPTDTIIEKDKPPMYLRKTDKRGLYFFSPKKTTIYYMSSRHVQELLEGKREFVCIHKNKMVNKCHTTP